MMAIDVKALISWGPSYQHPLIFLLFLDEGLMAWGELASAPFFVCSGLQGRQMRHARRRFTWMSPSCPILFLHSLSFLLNGTHTTTTKPGANANAITRCYEHRPLGKHFKRHV